MSTVYAWMNGFLELVFAKRLRTPEGIARRVPGVLSIFYITLLPFIFNVYAYTFIIEHKG